jgi:pimeloyl-ACP methyl ester carboxylesterase
MRALTTLALALVTLLTTGGCMSLDSFLFNPESVDEYHWDEVDPQLDGELTDAHPSVIGPDDRFEGFTEAGGQAVHYVFARRPGATDTIFYSHGNRKHLGRYWDRVELMWQLGYHVMVYDYPGFGRSEGEPTEVGIYDSAATVLDLLPTMPEVDTTRVWFFGYSLGGAPTYELAARAENGHALAPLGIIGEAIFCSVATLVQDGAFLDIPPSYVASFEFDNCAKAQTVTVPVLIIHGAEDSFLVPRHAQLLADRIAENELVIVPGAEHSDIPLVAGSAYNEWLRGFISPR